MARIGVWLVLLSVAWALAGCSEDRPTNTGPVIHCFNQDVATGKVTVTCPVEAP